MPLSDTWFDVGSLYTPVTDTGDRLFDLDDVEDDGELVVTDDDLRDEPNEDYHSHDYDIKQLIRQRRGLISDLVGGR